MFQLKDGRSLELCTFRVLLFHHTVVLLLLTHSCTGHPQVIGPPRPVLAFVGDDIILPCHLEPATDVASTAVEWTRPDLKPRFVHLWRSGQELLGDQHPSYSGRTSLFTNKLKHGDISLKLSRVKLSDKGTYRCFIPTMNIDSTVKLVFGSISSPEIKISKVSNGVLFVCRSTGWFPEPEVFWLDGEGNLLSAGPTETVRGPHDLYTVSSRVTVEKRHSNSFTCRVQQNSTNQIRETHIQVSDELFLVESSSALRISICLSVCLLAVAAVVFVMWKWGRNKTETKTNRNERQLLMEEDRQRLQLMTASERIKYLEKSTVKLDEDLQKTEGELGDVQQVITTLMKQKEDLKDQRERLISLQQDVNSKLEEKKKKLETKNPHFMKEATKNKYAKTIQDLENTMKEHKELLKNTNNLLEKTESLIIKMTERKANLERDKKQIDKNLKETERLREETETELQSEREKETN